MVSERAQCFDLALDEGIRGARILSREVSQSDLLRLGRRRRVRVRWKWSQPPFCATCTGRNSRRVIVLSRIFGWVGPKPMIGHESLFSITCAGIPTAVAPAGTSHNTTLMAPIFAFLPIRIPPNA